MSDLVHLIQQMTLGSFFVYRLNVFPAHFRAGMCDASSVVVSLEADQEDQLHIQLHQIRWDLKHI